MDWGLAGPKHRDLGIDRVKNGNRDSLGDFLAGVGNPDNLLSNFSDKIEVEVVYFHPGDLLIMPPGQYHTVYTPVAGFSQGGHLYNLDTMHLTELSRLVDMTRGQYPAQHAIRVIQVVLGGALQDGCLPSFIHHDSAALQMANTIAQSMLSHFGLNSLEEYRRFLSEANMFKRGEEVEIHDFLHALSHS
ncbi:hypothetical protein EV363DRAFT_1403474 [Boletus edulis]|nr:hypothetical protein EV363DRAFT_1403474 [Boletus edulis]